jgi:hypothetical protein
VLNWQHTEAPNRPIDTLPRPRASRNRVATIGQENLSNGLDPRLTLKLLVASHILRRSALLSSKALE